MSEEDVSLPKMTYRDWLIGQCAAGMAGSVGNVHTLPRTAGLIIDLANEIIAKKDAAPPPEMTGYLKTEKEIPLGVAPADPQSFYPITLGARTHTIITRKCKARSAKDLLDAILEMKALYPSRDIHLWLGDQGPSLKTFAINMAQATIVEVANEVWNEIVNQYQSFKEME